MVMKRVIIGGLAVSALLTAASLSSASAADMPLKAPPPVAAPVFSWTGFYIGASAGGQWGQDAITGSGNPVGFVPFGINVPVFNSALGTSLHPEGFIGGGQIGYNWQTGSYVFGLEGDANGLSGKATRNLTGAPLTAAGFAAADFVNDSAQASFLATFRGRVGVTFDRTLFYATGGGAWGTVKTTDTTGFFGGTVLENTSNTTSRSGWTVGGGVEYALMNNFSVKVEYLYVNLGNFNETIPATTGAPNTTVTINHSYTDNIARVGLNYKLN
jgi:outer membrane immunogenic protein